MFAALFAALPKEPPALPKLPDFSGVNAAVEKLVTAVEHINTGLYLEGLWQGAITAAVVVLVGAFWRKSK